MTLKFGLDKSMTSLLMIFSFMLLAKGGGTQILYLNENSASYDGASAYTIYSISDFTTSFTTSYQYAMSSWIKLPSMPADWSTLFKLSEHYSYSGHDSRILLAQTYSGDDFIFSSGTPQVEFYDWNPWENLSLTSMMPSQQWVFLAMGTDSTINTQYGFRYNPQSPTEMDFFYDTRVLNSSSYNVTPSCSAFEGGDNLHTSYGQTLQYLRLYIDYVPNSLDQMFNIAIMGPGGTLYYIYFTTDYKAVQNLTTPVDYYQNLSQGAIVANLNPTSSENPIFGPFNMIMCRPGTIFSYSAPFKTNFAIVVAFDVKIYSPANTTQNLFSIRNYYDNYVSLTTYYDPTDQKITVKLQNPYWNIGFTSQVPINSNQWNRVVVEIIKTNEAGQGFIAGRIFVNQSIPNRTYFGVGQALFYDLANKTIDICSTRVSESTKLDSTLDGTYDMMNFLWFTGNESLFQNSSDPTCFLSGFLSPNQAACLICNPGYYLTERNCVSTCPASYFLDSDTNSCQKCYYGNYFLPKNNSCVACNTSGYFISGYECLPCNSICLSCNGELPTNCTSCPLSSYFISTNNSCVACNINGYFISNAQCLQCESTCKTCNGIKSTNCNSCYQGYYLLTTNNTCTQCKNMSGYYANDTNQSCYPLNVVNILSFVMQESPQLYLVTFSAAVNFGSSLSDIYLYQISNSTNLISTNMSEVSFTLNEVTPTSYQLNFLGYTESNETRFLLLSFDSVNSNPNNSFIVIPPNSTAPIAVDSITTQAAISVGMTSEAIVITTAAASLLLFVQAKGKSAELMRILQIMARISFMKLINVNILLPLACFYKYTDLGQFGLPNVFSNMIGNNNTKTSTNPANQRLLTSLTSTSNSGIFVTDSQGNVVYNDYFSYLFSQVFLDAYGGIVFSTIITSIMYFLVKAGAFCIKNNDSKIKQFLNKLAHFFERSLIMTILVSRYMYLCSSLILNYAFIPLSGAYQIVSFVFAVFYTVLVVLILFLALIVSCYHSHNKVKLANLRPMFNLITLLCQDYHSKKFIGRIMTFWALLSNLIVILILELLAEWPIAQLVIMIILNLITIILSLPKKIYKSSVNKITTIGTELGFIIISILLLIMYFLENSGSSNSYNARLGLSWTAVVVNILIILLQIVARIVLLIQERRKKAQEEKTKKTQEEKTKKAIEYENQESQGPKHSRIRTKVKANDSQIVQLRRRAEPDSLDNKNSSFDTAARKRASKSRNKHQQ